ncbi:MAG: hypothetical protein HY688_01705, partial [Chloroflexi bacterium]|nr:hypothetical protein [Chloroflexota bacterium]
MERMVWSLRIAALGVGVVAGALALAVACAPATEPQAPTPTAEKPAAAQPTEQKPAEQKPAQPAKPTISVSGIPLDPAAKFGGILRTPHTGEGPTFSTWEERSGNPDRHVYPATNSIIRQQTWGTKEDTAKASYFNIVPDLAKSWGQSSDGLKWTFKLRDGVKWSDGTPFTCADAKWSLDSIRTGKDLRRSPAATHFLAVKDTQCADDMTLVVNMSKPKPGLLNVIAQPYNVVRPKHVYEKNTGLMREKPPTVGTGPFRVKEWLPGEKMTFERRADYWDQPFPYLDGIEIQIMTNAAMDAGLRAGRVDFGPGQGYSGPRLATMRQECKRCVFYDKVINPSISPALMINHQRPPWNTPLIKDAISYAWDRAKHNQLVQLGDFALPTGGFFLPGGGWEMPYERVKQIPGYNLEDPTGNKE